MLIKNTFISDIKQILESARQKAYQAINTSMVEAYWLVGKRIVEEEQQGGKRAEYGKEILKTLSKELTESFGKGFSQTNIRSFRMFYITFPELIQASDSTNSIQQTVSAKLSWSHYQLIMRVINKNSQHYYIKEAAENNWSVRTLDRNIASASFSGQRTNYPRDVRQNQGISTG